MGDRLVAPCLRYSRTKGDRPSFSNSRDLKTPSMTNHLIWAAGLLGHVLLLVVLFTRKRVTRFPWFTLLIFFYFLRTVLPVLELLCFLRLGDAQGLRPHQSF